MDPDQRGSVKGLHKRRLDSKPKPYPRLVETSDAVRPQVRGINVAGLEFGTEKPEFSNNTPGMLGRDYFLSCKATFDDLAGAGFGSFRIPFRWERIQPRLRGPLDPDGVQHLRLLISLAEQAGASALIDLHNYGRYSMQLESGPARCGFDEEYDGFTPLDADDFADLWARLSHALSGQRGLLGYGLMNEPHDLPAGAWVGASRAAVEAIRSQGDKTPIYVAGDRWSDASRWDTVNPESPWIEDPLGLVTYEAHCYLDHDGSGHYELSYEQELDYDPELGQRARRRLQPFLTWLEEWGVPGCLGEFAVPCEHVSWTALLPEMLQLLDEACVPTYWWAAGDHWGDYPLALRPAVEHDTPCPAQAKLLPG